MTERRSTVLRIDPQLPQPRRQPLPLVPARDRHIAATLNLGHLDRSQTNAGTHPAQREVFAPICPDLALELLSPSDMLSIAQAKLRQYIDNSCQLRWLLDRKGGIAEIYRADSSVEVLTQPRSLSDESVLPGFTLDLSDFWTEL
ncbi:MAG: hypothetical protein HC925_00580 [Coleofasciculaceae cyanobacterium SM2_3_26]|nr:hypothetical protein [Coleofasciculaceae cyanobacterium SM2_3_26]